ncbi:MAG: phytanoyl-CoA dioxygenase family protein [Acidimicrobiales bacterium]
MTSEMWLRRAEAMAAEGRCLEAIDVLSDANRDLGSPAIEERLVVLRRQAFAEVRGSRGRASWPPTFEDPFEGSEGVVETSAQHLSVEVLGGAVQHHGCLLVRELMSQPSVDRLVHAVERSSEAQQAWHQGAPLSQTTPWYVPMPSDRPGNHADAKRGLPLDLNRVCLADSPRAMFEVVEAFRQSGIDRLVTGYLGDRPVMTEKKWLLWRMDRRADVFAFHQEASVFNSGDDGLPSGKEPIPLRALNVWIALSHCGQTSPGFQFYPRRMSHVVEPDQLFGLKADTLEGVTGGTAVAAPIYAPGDAVLFDEFLLHRTKSDASMADVRYSLESWMFAPSGHPERDRQGPLVL